ncbi:MAG: hypothetical protein CL916_00365 [Deltaproteobacteria bacterium]|nr:hypothetical protein [Deltaproteobacteria bacterium]
MFVSVPSSPIKIDHAADVMDNKEMVDLLNQLPEPALEESTKATVTTQEEMSQEDWLWANDLTYTTAEAGSQDEYDALMEYIISLEDDSVPMPTPEEEAILLANE